MRSRTSLVIVPRDSSDARDSWHTVDLAPLLDGPTQVIYLQVYKERHTPIIR